MNDSILSLLQKLARLAADPAASDGEKATAQSKLRAIMQRHGLTDSDLSAPAREFEVECKSAADEILAVQCACQILSSSSVRVVRIRRRIGRGVRKFLSVTMSPAAGADWQDCYQHYAPAYRKERAALLRRHRAETKAFPVVFFGQNDIGGPTESSAPDIPLTPEEIEALLRVGNVRVPRWRQRALDDAPEPLALPATA